MAAATSNHSSQRAPKTAHEFRVLAVTCQKDPRTVAAAYEPGSRIEPNNHAAVTEAALRLGFLPPPPLAR